MQDVLLPLIIPQGATAVPAAIHHPHLQPLLLKDEERPSKTEKSMQENKT